MGNTIEDWQTICLDDGRCEYQPNPGAGPGTNLADFRGEGAFGAWRVCVGDAFGCGSNGTLEAAAITMLSW
jgi:hypothetical protein